MSQILTVDRNWKPTGQSVCNSRSTLENPCETYQTVCTRLYSFVLRLYSVCTPLYSCLLRLYSFVPLVMSFPSGFCTPFAFVCTLTPFCEYHTFKKREEYKSTKACKYAPSIVLGARWPNGITTARAVAAAPVPLHAWTRSFAYMFAKHLINSYILCPKGWGRACASPSLFPSYNWFPDHGRRLEILAKRTKHTCVGRGGPQ